MKNLIYLNLNFKYHWWFDGFNHYYFKDQLKLKLLKNWELH